MYSRWYTVMRLLGQMRWRRLTLCLLTVILAFVLTLTLVNPLVLFRMHRVWDSSGLGNAALFSTDYRFSDWPMWDGMAPAYRDMMLVLNELPNVRTVTVGSCFAILDERLCALRVYPSLLAERVKTPTSEGMLPAQWDDPDMVPVVLDVRLRSVYRLGDRIEITPEGYRTPVPAVVMGFLNNHNDHVALQRGGSFAHLSNYVAQDARGYNDGYIILATEHPLIAQAQLAINPLSVLLFTKDGAPVDGYMNKWREKIRALYIGQIDSYSTIRMNDLYISAVLEQSQLYLICLWLLLLIAIGLLGHCLMQGRAWERQFAVYRLLGLTARRTAGYILIAGYLPFLLSAIVGALCGLGMTNGMAENARSVAALLVSLTLIIAILPCAASAMLDIRRVWRMDPLALWRERGTR